MNAQNFRAVLLPSKHRLFSTTAIKKVQASEGRVPFLCSPSWLATELKKPESRIVPVDGSWHMPGASRDAKKEFKESSIENSRFFDIDVASDKTNSSPHMLPTANFFSEYLSTLNISKDDHVVIYDSVGIFSSCRVFWTFKIFGHKKVSLLNGGLPRWVSEGFPTLKPIQSDSTKTNYPTSELNYNSVKSYSEIKTILANESPKTHIIDARSGDRFSGKSPEPRPEISSGHMPRSISLPFTQVLDKVNEGNGYTRFKKPQELQQVFKSLGVNQGDSVVFSCGTGVTACVLDFALNYAITVSENQLQQSELNEGRFNTSVYDGSWTEYAMQKDSIIIKDN